jgi:myo-inositol-1(or 4)-monophosphatase
MIDLDDALTFVVDLAKECGAIARKHHSPDVVFDPKANNSPVTLADIEINNLVIKRCNTKYPDIGILAEEQSTAHTKEWLWVCDPIDGTIPYMLGMQASTFCLALVHDGQPVVGVVYDFMNDRLFSAIKGKGAQMNDKVISPAPVPPLRLVEVEIYPGAPHHVGDLRRVLTANKWQTQNFATVSFVAMAAATGRVAGTVYTGDKAWDVAAAKVIVEECGGTVTDLDGNDQRYDGTITGAMVLHPAFAQEITAMVVESRKKLA